MTGERRFFFADGPTAAGAPTDRHSARADPELAGLVNDVIDGSIDAGRAAALEARLVADPAARRYFLDAMLVHSQLAAALSAASPTVLVDLMGCEAPPQPVGRSGRFAAAAALVAAMLAAAAVLGGPAVLRVPGRIGSALWATPLATVADARLVLVGEGQRPLEPGDTLAEGRVSFEGGAVEVLLRNGVMLVLEGPVDLLLQSEMKAFVQSGKVLVRMPSGMSGFRLETPSASLLDLGTEFAVHVGATGATDVQVYDGEVIATGRNPSVRAGFPRKLLIGDACRFSADAAEAVAGIPFTDERFIRSARSEPGKERYFADPIHAAHDAGTPRTESIRVTRPAAAVAIDGRLDDWPAAPGFRRQRDDASADDSVAGWMMHDAERLYIAAHIRDPAPMRNVFDPALGAAEAWRGGGLHVRLSTDRAMGWPADADGPDYFTQHRIAPDAEQVERSSNPRLAHLLMWYHAASRAPCLAVAYGMHVGDQTVNPSGFEGAFVMDRDGRGYVLEYSIPWRVLHAEANPPRPGDTLPVSWQAYWSDTSGRLWRDQVIEVRNLQEPARIFTFERAAVWGRAEYE